MDAGWISNSALQRMADRLAERHGYPSECSGRLTRLSAQTQKSIACQEGDGEIGLRRPSQACAEKLAAHRAAGVQRVFVWPVSDELDQLAIFREKVAPSVGAEDGTRLGSTATRRRSCRIILRRVTSPETTGMVDFVLRQDLAGAHTPACLAGDDLLYRMSSPDRGWRLFVGKNRSNLSLNGNSLTEPGSP